jgi:hypothetical protein
MSFESPVVLIYIGGVGALVIPGSPAAKCLMTSGQYQRFLFPMEDCFGKKLRFTFSLMLVSSHQQIGERSGRDEF